MPSTLAMCADVRSLSMTAGYAGAHALASRTTGMPPPPPAMTMVPRLLKRIDQRNVADMLRLRRRHDMTPAAAGILTHLPVQFGRRCAWLPLP